MNHNRITYRRSELYEQVWTEPMTKVAARLGVSDVALAKVCRKLGVPSPPRGYWAKRQFGQTPRRPPLSPLRAGQKEEITTRRKEDADAKVAGAGIAPVGPNPEVIVPPTLERPHDLVAAMARDLRRALTYLEPVVAAAVGALAFGERLGPLGLFGAAFDIALIHTALGDKGKAFQWLQRAYEERSGFSST